jgi:hypothetical protein
MNHISMLKNSNGSQSETLVTLFGVIIPWSPSPSDKREEEFKLACESGLEYILVADSEWRNVLSNYCWQDVKIKGLLNISNMTLVPRKIIPKGPKGEKENVIDMAAWKGQDLVRKLAKNVVDLVLVPAAVYAVMS